MCKQNILALFCVVVLVLTGVPSAAADDYDGVDGEMLLDFAEPDCEDVYEEDEFDEGWEECDFDEMEEIEELMEEFGPEALKYLKSINKTFYGRLTTENGDIHPEFEEPVVEFVAMWAEWKETQEKFIEFELKHFALRGYVDLLVDDYHETKGQAERKEIRGEIQKVLVDLFDLEIARREYRVAELQKELDEVKSELKKAKSNKEGQIKAYLDKLTSTQTIFER